MQGYEGVPISEYWQSGICKRWLFPVSWPTGSDRILVLPLTCAARVPAQPDDHLKSSPPTAYGRTSIDYLSCPTWGCMHITGWHSRAFSRNRHGNPLHPHIFNRCSCIHADIRGNPINCPIVHSLEAQWLWLISDNTKSPQSQITLVPVEIDRLSPWVDFIAMRSCITSQSRGNCVFYLLQLLTEMEGDVVDLARLNLSHNIFE